jgi:hypothetical protein
VHPDHSEEVGIEDRLRLLDGTFFRSSGRNAEAGIVHEQVDAAFQPDHFFDGSSGRLIPRHVKRQLRKRLLVCLRRASAGAIDRIARNGEPLCRGLSDA